MDQVVEGGTPAKILVTDKQRDAIRDAIASALGSSAYDCDRVWSAWSVGTMGEDDFAAIAQNDERIREVADAAIEALQQHRYAPPAEGEVGELATWLHDCANVRMDEGYEGPALRYARAAALLKQQSLQPVGAITAAEAERLAHGAGFSAVYSDENELRQTFVVWEATTAQLTAVVNAAIAFDRARRAAPPAKWEVA